MVLDYKKKGLYVRCTSPRKVGFQSDGKTIAWSQKTYNKEYPTFQLPCGKCLECRLEYSRQWAIRCVHEAKMHTHNSFITLTYSDEFLKSDKLIYKDFQDFMKRLRKHNHEQFISSFGESNWLSLSKESRKEHINRNSIGIFVTGEYGERRKRPHWHAIIFNWRPADLKYKYTNDHGDRVYTSDTLTSLWQKGNCELGSVTMHSASYCARYAAKKLVHGKDHEHEFHPISKKSQRNAIGKKFLEKYWTDIFNHGSIILDNGQRTSIPRYYEKWLQKHKPEEWLKYVKNIKSKREQQAEAKAREVEENYGKVLSERLERGNLVKPTTERDHKKIIQEQKFQQLQQYLKGDI